MNHKSIFIAVVISLLTSASTLKAQMTIGSVHGGYHQSWWQSEQGRAGNPLQGFFAGFYFTDIKGVVAPYIGVDYFRNGWQTDNNYRYINTLSLQLAIRFNIGPVFIYGGPAADLTLGQKYVIDGEDAWTRENTVGFIDMPVFAGIGVQIGPVNLEARYFWGISFPTETEPYRNEFFQIGVGFTFIKK